MNLVVVVPPGGFDPVPEVAHASERAGTRWGTTSGPVAGDAVDEPVVVSEAAQPAAGVAGAHAVVGVAHADDGIRGGVAREEVASGHFHASLSNSSIQYDLEVSSFLK